MSLAIRNVSFSYSALGHISKPVLRNIKLELRTGEIVTVIGESGSGKTTLLNIVAGLLIPSTGAIERAGSISYLFQEDMLLPFRTVWQNSVLAAELRSESPNLAFDRAKHLLSITRLIEIQDGLPATLSGGMRRRLALVRQLTCTSDLLLLDEPFTAQDRGMREGLEGVIFDRSREEKVSILLVTHDIDSAIAISNRIFLLTREGELSEAWQAPKSLSQVPPGRRRSDPMFVNHITVVTQRFWENSRA